MDENYGQGNDFLLLFIFPDLALAQLTLSKGEC